MTTPTPPEPDYSAMQELFSDLFEWHINPWSFVLTFGRRSTKADEPNEFQIRMRMPLQQAKAMAVMLLSGIREYEQKTGADIELPEVVLKDLKIAPEDWKRFKG